MRGVKPLQAYLGVKLDYSVHGKLSVNMVNYVKTMLAGFKDHIPDSSKVASPWNAILLGAEAVAYFTTTESRAVPHPNSTRSLPFQACERPDITVASPL
eukprot:scaffold44881_cov176-Amphora_coffeaeformis.AAC.2